MASQINKYSQNIARARYATPSYRAPQRRATIDPSLFKGKTAAKGAPLASRPIEGGPALPSPQEYNPIIDAESGEDPNAPRVETQQPIENRGDSARYMIQGGGPRIDLSFLVPERANKAYDPSKAIGGENVPYQESKGIGGFFRRLLGDESNRMNIEAQQAQGAEWREAEKEAQKEERLLNRMREADKPTQERFKITQAAAEKAEADRVAAENKRLELEGKRVGLTERQIEEARLDRIERLRGEQADRDARIEDMRNRNALADYTVGLNQLKSNQPQMIGLSGGGMGVFDPRSGSVSIVNPGTAGFGEKFPGTPSTTRQVYPPPQFKPSGSGGGQVDRTTGATLGEPLVAPTRSGISLDGVFGEPTELPPGGGVRMGGPLPAPPQNTALIPRFMRGAGDVMGGAMTYATDPLRYAGTDVYKKLFSSSAQQDPEVLKRLKKREEESSPWDIQ